MRPAATNTETAGSFAPQASPASTFTAPAANPLN